MSHNISTAWLHYIVDGSQCVVLTYFLTLTALYLILVLLSWRWCRDNKKKVVTQPIDFDALDRLRKLVPPLTIIVPAYNEEKVIVESVRSLLGSSYARLEIVIVNDGSSDATLSKLVEGFSLRKSEVQ